MLSISKEAAGEYTVYEYYKVLAFENLETAKQNYLAKNPPE